MNEAMRSAIITREVGSSVYWVEFKLGGNTLNKAIYLTRWGARRASDRWVRKSINPYREEVQ